MEQGARDQRERISLEELYHGKSGKLLFERAFPTGFSLDGVTECENAQICGSLTDYSGQIQFRADVRFFYETVCDRCLKPIKSVLEFSIDAPAVNRKESENAEGETVVVENEALDLKEIVTRGVLEYLPAKHLCKDACKGLCPSCGADLNEGACSCKKPVDPRLEGLKEFFK